jgi:hypothetical protein
MINKILDRLNERVVFGAVLFTILIGNPMRVIVGEAMKANAAPTPQVEQQQQFPAPKAEFQTEDVDQAFVNRLCSKEYEEVRAKIVYKALTSDVETPEEVKNYQTAVVILQVCPRNNVSY